jgi:Na+-transporting NADH:ubiquinone oxidoreductase subunit NqrB
MRHLFQRLRTYHLMLYYMVALLAGAGVLAALGMTRFSAGELAFSAAAITATCWAVNELFARSFGAVTHWDSILITGLILTFMIDPFGPMDGIAIGFALFASAWAAASKYLLASRERHIFNPAALGAGLGGLALHRTVGWWVGDYAALLPVIVLGGALVLQRLRYFDLVASFAVTVLVILLVKGGPAQFIQGATQTLAHSMFAFFALVMLTEPRTTPLGRWRHIALGVLVGVGFSPIAHIGTYYFTPEVALLAGNLFTFLSNRRRLERWKAAFA